MRDDYIPNVVASGESLIGRVIERVERVLNDNANQLTLIFTDGTAVMFYPGCEYVSKDEGGYPIGTLHASLFNARG